MSQITTGAHGVFSIPSIYNFFQNLIGARSSRRKVAQRYIKAKATDVIVDVGCGTAMILEELPKGVDYYGFDLSSDYVAAAESRYGGLGSFECLDITSLPEDAIPPCDIALALGVLHHLDDDDARALLTNLFARLAPGGRLITIDGCYCPGQSPIARKIISMDRGQNVRTGDGYLSLVPKVFSDVQLVREDHLLRIPYTHAIMVCTK